MTPTCALIGAGWGAELVGAPTWTVRTLDELDPRDPFTDVRRCADDPSWWVGAVSYDVGRLIEPSATALPRDGVPAADDRAVPALALARVEPGGTFTPAGGYTVGAFSSHTGRERYIDDVARSVELIHAGDCFQVNLAHRLSAPIEGDARAMSAALFERLHPGFGAHLELPGHTIVSVSPELFLRYDAPTRRVETRPIKGTRPVESPAGELERAEKDRAELAMITDLMRNDLGRVAQRGSVRVDEERTLEDHAGTLGVRHASSLVSCTLDDGVGLAELLSATFPPGSVTGAPKVRSMQVIDALEPVRRGFYCGCIFLIAPDGSMTASVPIRTLTIDHARSVVDLPVGAGIVADSDPQAEWDETMTKARAIVGAITAGATSGTPGSVAHA